MDQATEIEATRIEELLSAYRELQSQFDQVRERLRRAEDHRQTVPRRIYDRVRADYDRELDSIRARLSPLRDELDRVHASIEVQCHDAGAALHALEEELAEAEFRHRIGEYLPPAFEDMRRALDARAADARSELATLETTLSAIATMRSPETGDVPEPATPVATPSEAPEAIVPAPSSTTLSALSTDDFVDDLSAIVIDEPPSLETVTEPAPPLETASPEEFPGDERSIPDAIESVPAPRIDNFENPQQWIREMGADSSRPERRVRLTNPVAPPSAKTSTRDEIDSVLAPLAERAAASAPSPAVAEMPRRPSAPSLPSLVFVSGPHTGQSIALLPTTLTIGREHDNNIEIKDPEVARYHARILREREDFVVEDLNSSTGTFVNGERAQRSVLSHGDVIRVGNTELALDYEWTTDSR
jgi:pSer/pThr/pTyr-binding forkhead associated (FHA) protein